MNHQKVRISTDSLQGVELYVQFPMREPTLDNNGLNLNRFNMYGVILIVQIPFRQLSKITLPFGRDVILLN